MSFLQKPNNIYSKELPKIGKDANPNLTYHDRIEKLNLLQILIRGFFRIEMDPKHYRRYDDFVLNFKVYALTILIGVCLFYMVFHSSFMSEPYNAQSDYDFRHNYINRFINFLIETFSLK